MKRFPAVPAFFTALALALCSSAAGGQEKTAPSKPDQSPAAPSTKAAREYSGMYAFLKDGEFVQVTIEDTGAVTGFISRYGDGESDKGAFLDQFFKSGKLEGNKLTFTTETVHGVWFEFKGTVERGEGKNAGDEGYYVLKGALIQNTADVNKKVSSRTKDVVFKIFPQTASPSPVMRN